MTIVGLQEWTAELPVEYRGVVNQKVVSEIRNVDSNIRTILRVIIGKNNSNEQSALVNASESNDTDYTAQPVSVLLIKSMRYLHATLHICTVHSLLFWMH